MDKEFSIANCEQLRAARRAKGLTQAQLAQRVGCQQSAVSMMEAGRVTALAPETRERIAAELGVVLAGATESPVVAVVVPVAGRAFCTEPDCPTNVPFVVSGVLLFWPRVQAVPGGRHCAACGEVLAQACGKCGAPVAAGACCRDCGTPYVSAVALPTAEPNAWAEARRQQIAAWRALL
jgi:DNA-binding XRE family transcriptional regulator